MTIEGEQAAAYRPCMWALRVGALLATVVIATPSPAIDEDQTDDGADAAGAVYLH